MRNYCNNVSIDSVERVCEPVPRIVVVGLASCFGCQLQITNMEDHLMEVLGQIDLRYWQMTSSGSMPDYFDVAIIEGAITTQESLETVKMLREKAKSVIAIGACANTAGIPGIAAAGFEGRVSEVYDTLPAACGQVIVPQSIPSAIDVDFQVLCCPIDFWDFVQVLSRALYGSNKSKVSRTMCGDCKRNETSCFYAKGKICLGLVTKAACGARCVNRGRPCNGCAGISPDANVTSARQTVRDFGLSVPEFDHKLQMFNQTNESMFADVKDVAMEGAGE